VPILKAPSKRPQNTALHAWAEETVRHNLDKYTEVMEADPSYVASEVLRPLFRKGIAFKRWAERRISYFIPGQFAGDALTKMA